MLKRYNDQGAVENVFYTKLQLSKGNSNNNNESSSRSNNFKSSGKKGHGDFSHRGKQGGGYSDG